MVVLLPSSADTSPFAVRVSNVTSTSFEVVAVEPSPGDGPHGDVVVHYLAVEAGNHLLPDGTRLEAGTLSVTQVQHGSGVTGAEAWATLTFPVAFSAAPALIAGLQTTANEIGTPPGAPSVPWLTVELRTLTASSVQLALERSEVGTGTVILPETVGWVAVAAGAQPVIPVLGGGTVRLAAIRSADTIRGVDNGCVRVAFPAAFPAAPLVAGHLFRHDEGDGGWLLRCAVDTTGVDLVVDEDVAYDAERAHTTEAAGLLVAETAFAASLSGLPDPPTVAFAAASASGEEGYPSSPSPWS